MSNQQVTYTFKLIEKITAPMRAVTKTFNQLEATSEKARRSMRRLPLNIADLRGELAALDQKRAFARTTTQVRQLNGLIRTTEKQLRKLENLPPKGFMSRMRELPKMFGLSLKQIGFAFAIRETTRFISSSTQLYDIQAKAETQLLTALKGRAGVQERLMKQAAELQGKTLYGDEETIQAQALIAAFVKEEDHLKKIIPLVQDLATAKHMDLNAAANLVSKTLGSSTNALHEYGIEVNGTVGSAERLESLMTALNDAFGGQAEAAAKAGAGIGTQITNKWNDIRELIGKLSVDVLQKWGPKFLKLLEFVEAKFTTVVKGLKVLALTLIEYKTIMFTTNKLMWLFAHRAGLMRLATIKLRGGLKGLITSFKALNVATKANVIGILVTAVAAAVTYFAVFRKKTDEVTKALEEAKKVGSDYYAEQKMGLDMMFEKLRKTNPQTAERNKLVNELKEMYPGLNEQMLQELKTTNNLSAAYDLLIGKIHQKAMIKAQEAALAEAYSQTAEAERLIMESVQEQISRELLEQGKLIPEDIKTDSNKEWEQEYRKNRGKELYDETVAEIMAGGSAGVDLNSTVWADFWDKDFKKYRTAANERESILRQVSALQFDSFTSGSTGGTEFDFDYDANTDPDTQLNTITGGGRQVKNITINLDALINENNNIFAPGEGIDQGNKLREELTALLQSVLNDTNLAMN
jgi:hypothetical protein